MATLIHNARIYVERGVFAEALLEVDGIIRAVGTLAEVEAAAPACVTRRDAKGRTIVPGFNDSHQHLLNTGIALADIRLGDCRSIAEVQDVARRWIAENNPAPGTVIHGMRWNQDYFAEGRLLTAADLDEISTEHPIIFDRACGHLLTCNTLAMQMAGITRDSVAPEGGTIERDADGNPNGVFTENARQAVRSLMASRSVEETVRLIRTGMAHAAQCGVTSVQTCDLRGRDWETTLEAYNQVAADQPLTRVWHQSSFQEPEGYRRFLERGCVMGSGTPFNRFGPLKLFIDGSLGARTALMRAPYADDPSTCGVEVLTPAQIDELVGLANSHNCGGVAHAIGDLAIERMLDAFDAHAPGDGTNPLRNGIVHVQITDRALVERFTKNDILALVQPIFLHYDTQIVEDRVGAELAGTSYAFGSMHRLGIHMSFGTDSPIEDMNPFENIYCAVTRRTLQGKPEGGFHPEECLDVETAVDAYTIESAYATFEENVKGRLMPGYYADLVILSDDIFTVPHDAIKSIRAVATMVDGRWVHDTEA